MRNKKGFTLMEMLIVVAIIAILISIAIPTFSNQLEKAREAADLANIRNAYAQLYSTVELNMDPTSHMRKLNMDDGLGGRVSYYNVYVKVTQKIPGWQSYGGAKYVQIGEDGYVAGINRSKKLSKYYKLNYYVTPITGLDALNKQVQLPMDVLIRFSAEMSDSNPDSINVYP